jgi:hypothetical protein
MTLPAVAGSLDLAYLRQALARAGLDEAVDSIETRPLTDGRSGAVVTGVRTVPGGHRLVHKAIKDGVGFHGALGGVHGGEGALWDSGVLAGLPAPLFWPVLDAERNDERGETWLLMDDVSEGILPPGSFDGGKFDRMLGGVAALHAAHWNDEAALARAPLLDLLTTAQLFITPVVTRGRGAAPKSDWERWMIDSFVVGRYLPRFLDVVGPRAADDYLAMAEDHAPWLRSLGRHEPTLLHNDLRRANISYLDDGRVALLDWERAARGPAAVDLCWLWFLQFWAYPPRVAHDPDAHRAAYLARLDAALGRRVDREAFDHAWGLGWVLVMCELGFLLADVLHERPDLPADEAAQRIRVAKEALDLARRAVDRG